MIGIAIGLLLMPTMYRVGAAIVLLSCLVGLVVASIGMLKTN